MNLRCFSVVLIGAAALVAAWFLFSQTPVVFAKTLDELRQELESKRKSLQDTESKIKTFQETIRKKRQEARTLDDQIGIIDDNIQEIELTVTQTIQKIDEATSEIEAVQAEIEIKEGEIDKQKLLLAQYIRSIQQLDQQSTVTIFLKYETFSEAMNESSALEALQNRAQATLTTIQQLHSELTSKRRELEDFKQSLNALRRRQEAQQKILTNEKDSKKRILDLTNAQESQYRSLLTQAQQEHKAAQAAIASLDSAIREELNRQGYGKLPSVGTFNWPIEPIFGVSCAFHCAGYPYSYLIGPHTGTDIPTYVGTPIKAPADGYVAKLHDSGGRGYSYILLLHGDNISTVFGHVSGFGNVREGELVTRGTVIGYTGGAPGSHGSGLSTGPHLHFEVRINNQPVNAQKYLPSL
ncbi:MAG: peptidoglycan DD-metalloendopeptidase family protein [Candidatus Andersenbacteria bacterium]|nr:peptidoglycan DD-metalloendopeptidase family protein [Candidatus Andersenbacteria bacterium]